MSRRPGNPSRRFGGGGSLGGLLHPKTRVSPLVTILLILGVVAVVVYFYRHSGLAGFNKVALSRINDGDLTCTSEVSKTLAYLRKAYGDSMHRILHVGPDSCSVVSKLVKEEGSEAWGVEPYDIEDADVNCKSLVHRGVVRVADIKFLLPYRPKSFSLSLVSDATDYLSPKYLNKTLPELARVSSDGLIIFTGSPGQSKAKVTELTKFGRPAKMRSSTWWTRFFTQISLEENEAANKKFQQAVKKGGYKPKCQVFHLKSYH
ncbi:PREDICTED: uncharacterized protein At3g49720-like [Ipomoea nil]|uniref:uncharacterized protein At3g49720-like n=1 Tax=Ipomoea nil TaxID=35883 RepID=UPI0009019461|nr:PREDICTED: uncharacterized protein At3g49720-like [Ipomoea nil]